MTNKSEPLKTTARFLKSDSVRCIETLTDVLLLNYYLQIQLCIYLNTEY